MSERYVKDILEKLEEIEKLHAKLRSLVPRVKGQESENTSSTVQDRLKNVEIKEHIMNEKKGNEQNSPQYKLDGDSDSDKSLKKNKSPSISDKYRKMRNNSVNFITDQWHDKKDKLKNILSTINERSIILVSRASQTSNDEQSEATSKEQSITRRKENQFPLKEKQLSEKKRHTIQELLERLLEHFNYSRDSDLDNGIRVSMHDHSLSNHKPHKVQKAVLLSEDEVEALRIISSALKVSNRR